MLTWKSFSKFICLQRSCFFQLFKLDSFIPPKENTLVQLQSFSFKINNQLQNPDRQIYNRLNNTHLPFFVTIISLVIHWNLVHSSRSSSASDNPWCECPLAATPTSQPSSHPPPASSQPRCCCCSCRSLPRSERHARGLLSLLLLSWPEALDDATVCIVSKLCVCMWDGWLVTWMAKIVYYIVVVELIVVAWIGFGIIEKPFSFRS